MNAISFHLPLCCAKVHTACFQPCWPIVISLFPGRHFYRLPFQVAYVAVASDIATRAEATRLGLVSVARQGTGDKGGKLPIKSTMAEDASHRRFSICNSIFPGCREEHLLGHNLDMPGDHDIKGKVGCKVPESVAACMHPRACALTPVAMSLASYNPMMR